MKEPGNATHESLPPGYRFGGRWQISPGSRAQITMAASMIVVFFLSLMLGSFARGFVQGSGEGQVAIEGFGFIAVVFGIIAGFIIIHELLHAALFIIFGARPRFGFKTVGRFFAAAYTTSGKPISRNRYLAVCLGPLLVISVSAMVISVCSASDNIAAMALLGMALNTSGSTGDVLMASRIKKHDSSTLFQDREDGFIWFIREP